jgi:hypothetical protein
VPDKRSHRGPHPEDLEAFSLVALPRLVEATADLSWLLTRGYSPHAALKIVGDHLSLTARQRLGVQRSACSDQSLAVRVAKEVGGSQVNGQPLSLDGFNVLTTVEAALAGGIVLVGRDGCLRDMASIHGHYQRVEETRPAIMMIGQTLARLLPAEVVWLLDRPVSNSGRLATSLRQIAAEHRWPWRVELVNNPDTDLLTVAGIIATADSVVLDRCGPWFNLARETIRERVPAARLVDFAQRG